MLTINNASVADIPTIRELCMQVWPQTYTPILGHEQVAYMLHRFYAPASLEKQMVHDRHQFIICCSDGVAVAFASWSQVEEQIFKLHKLYVLPGLQGKGIARATLEHILHNIRANGAKELRLNVNRYNFQAKIFYEKTGFKHLADEDIDIGGGYFMNDHVLVMELGLG